MSHDKPDATYLIHPATLDGGVDLDQARLTDFQRLSGILQGAALLAHLEHSGLHLPAGWDAIGVHEGGLLTFGAPRRGRAADPTQLELLRLTRRLFRTEGSIAGRGEAKGAARYLLTRWHQTLVPLSPDQAIAEILEAAPFLWQPAFADARTRLLAEHRKVDAWHCWVVGPGGARQRLLRRGGDRAGIEALLRADNAADVWEGYSPDDDGVALAEAGRFRQAVAFWRRQPPSNPRHLRLYAQSLFALGRYSKALRLLKGRTQLEARLLRLKCQLSLGELGAAQRALTLLEKLELTGEQILDIAEVAAQLAYRRSQSEISDRWIARAFQLAPPTGRLRWRVELVAAEAAWDRQDYAGMRVHLEAGRGALDEKDLVARWHQVQALLALGVHDAATAAQSLKVTLTGRRQMLRSEAGRRWNDLGMARVLLGDLPGAERACRHALRLLSSCEGPVRETLGLYNLAEVRLRRGRIEGVEQALKMSMAENRRAGNIPGLINDLALWMRYELTLGRASVALAHAAEAAQVIDGYGKNADEEVFDLLAARAHGWLGQAKTAAVCLQRVSPRTFDELEPEERPAVWALAGRADEAADQAAGTRWEPFWSAHVAGFDPDPSFWDLLSSLESFRSARLVFDCELVRPGSVPPEWVSRAIRSFQQTGAESLAEKLESRSLSPWRALERYLAHPRVETEHAEALLQAAGYHDVRLCFAVKERERLLIPGKGGSFHLQAPFAEGHLVLSSPVEDPTLRCLFTLLQRDLKLPAKDAAHESHSAASVSGILGQSQSLAAALSRLDRLAVGEMPILVLGETGTGKELAARRVHLLSSRCEGPFLAINCAALPQTLIQSDLFGHVRGAFTNADRDRPGIFESARGGIVFLDEIGDLPLEVQTQLLRVLQAKEIRRVGESFNRKIDVRIVAATHRNLATMVGEGTFREDLFFRLQVGTAVLPPLRQRGRDVLLLAEHFLARQAKGKEPLKMSAQVRGHLLRHSWPGNIRELENVLEVAAALTDTDEIALTDLDLPATDNAAVPRGDYHQLVKTFRTNLLSEAMQASNGNRAQAARRLGLTRQALSYLVRQLDIT